MLCIIQSRLSSSRLPGKMLMNIGGKTLLENVFQRVKKSKKISKIIVATSNDPSDDPIKELCASKLNTKCYRGSLSNVADRFRKVIIEENVDEFVRISGDSPLIPPDLIDDFINEFNSTSNIDVFTNTFQRTYPKGFSVEIVSAEAFYTIFDNNLTKDQKEHVTKYFYDNPKEYKILNKKSNIDLSHLNFCVDTFNDLVKIEKILNEIDLEKSNWLEICKYNSGQL